MKLADIENRLATLAEALAADGVGLACVFGSVLERPSARDVDLGVWFEEYSFERYLRALELAQQVLGTGRVDLVVLKRVSAPLKLRALLEGRLLYAATPTAPVELAAEALWEYGVLGEALGAGHPPAAERCHSGRRQLRLCGSSATSALDSTADPRSAMRQRSPSAAAGEQGYVPPMACGSGAGRPLGGVQGEVLAHFQLHPVNLRKKPRHRQAVVYRVCLHLTYAGGPPELGDDGCALT